MFPHATCMCVKSVKECQQRHSNKKSVDTPWRLSDSTAALIKIDILSSAQVTNLLKATDNRPTKGTEVKQVIKLCPNFVPLSSLRILMPLVYMFDNMKMFSVKNRQSGSNGTAIARALSSHPLYLFDTQHTDT